MANTYTQFYAHLVFAVKNRNALIKKQWKNELEMYITGITQNHKHKMLAISSMPDHIHIFIGYNVNHLIPDLVEEIKTSSNAWIKNNRLSNFRFEWQKGYGAFSNSQSQIDAVVKYVMNQESHHKKTNFKDEYLEILKKTTFNTTMNTFLIFSMMFVIGNNCMNLAKSFRLNTIFYSCNKQLAALPLIQFSLKTLQP